MNDAIFINYDPFGMESQVLVVKDNKTVGDTYCRSELDILAAAVVRSAHEHGIQRVLVRAPMAIYSELTTFVQTQELNTYAANKIIMERVR